MDSNSITSRINISATPSDIWDVLTNPAKIILYLGSQTHTDWVVGSLVTWEGEMNGMKFKNKGRILKNDTNVLLSFTYWSGMGGDSDSPENYSQVTYTLNKMDGDSVELVYTRVGIPTALEKQIFEMHLPSMLGEIKRLSETN